MKYAKAWISIFGATITSALAIVSPSSGVWTGLTILSAAVTAAGVYLVPNTPPK